MRWILVACQATSILITWSVWQVRDANHPLPNLPLIQWAPQFPMGLILLSSLALILIRPGWGLVVHATALAVSIVQDEARLQPEFLSLALLLVGTLPGRWKVEFARAHLGSLWLWAGLHKLMSTEYWAWQGEVFVTVYWPEAPYEIALVGSVVVAFSELYLGIAAFIPRLRHLVPIGATIVHVGVLLWLVGQPWNYAVWPWQIGLIVAAWFLFSEPSKQHAVENAGDALTNHRARWGIILAMITYPLLYYANLLPPAVVWCVYSGNVPAAKLFPPATIGEESSPRKSRGKWLGHTGLAVLNVPYPTMPSSCERFLRWYGKEGASITIRDPRPLSLWRGRGRIVLTKIAGVVEIDAKPASGDADEE